jgi:hypothetical protein
MPSSPIVPRVYGTLINAAQGYMLTGGAGSTMDQAYTGGAAHDVFYDTGGAYGLIAGDFASSATGTLGCFIAVSYPGMMVANGCGYFSQYTSLVDAEILNIFGDDMYIGPYFDPTGGTAGSNIIYRSGAGNEGDGAHFVNTFQEFTWNDTQANALAKTNTCFTFKGRAGDTSKEVMKVQALATGVVVQTLTTTATNDDPTEKVVQNRAATTNATVTALHTFTVPASTTYAVEAIVIARRTGGAAGTAEDGARYKLSAVYKNVAGTATIIGVVTTTADESVAAYDATLVATGATVELRVTGVLNTNITWHMTARTYQVST